MDSKLIRLATCLGTYCKISCGCEVFWKIFAAYNRYQEDERYGVDYIFDIHNSDDVACVIKGGLSIDELYALKGRCESVCSKYFFFGQNHEKPQALSVSGVIVAVRNHLSEIASCILKYHDKVPEYQALYELFEERICVKAYAWKCTGSDGGHAFTSEPSNTYFKTKECCYEDIQKKINSLLRWAFKFDELGFSDNQGGVYETSIEHYENGVILKMYTGTYTFEIIEFDL